MQDTTNDTAKQEAIKQRGKRMPTAETPVGPIAPIAKPGEGEGNPKIEGRNPKGEARDEVRERAQESMRRMGKRAAAEKGGGMRVSVAPKAVLRAVKAVLGAVGKRSGLPVLGCVQVVARGMSVQVTATDLDVRMSAVAQSGVEVHVEGGCCVNAAALVALLERAVGDAVELVQRGGELEVSSGGWTAKLYVMPAEEFPTAPLSAVEVMARVSGRVLSRLMGLVKGCVSTDATWYVLNGVFLEVKPGGMLTAVATDGRRLCRAWVPGASSEWEECSAVLPSRVVGLLRGMLGAAEDEVELRMLRDAQGKVEHIELQAEDGTALWAKVIQGNFPAYEKVIPDSTVREDVVLDVEAFTGMVERAGFLSGKAPSLGLKLKGRLLTLSVEAGEAGSWEEVAEVLTEEGRAEREFAVRVNPDFLPDLGAIERTVVQVNVAHARKTGGPLVWEAETDCGERRLGWTYVLMPMRDEK